MHSITSTLPVLLAIVITAGARSADAQSSQPAIVREAMRPDILLRDVEPFARDLDLEPAQVELLRFLVLDYHEAIKASGVGAWFDDERPAPPDTRELDETRDRFRAELRELLAADPSERDDAHVRARILEMKEAWREAVPRPDAETLEARADRRDRFSIDLADRLRDWNEEKARLLAQFLEDVPAILGETQRARWSETRRRFVRRLSLDRGRLSGERVDLVALVGGLALPSPETDSIAPLLSEYEIAIEAALIARDAAVDRARIAMLRAHATGDRGSTLAHAEAQTAARLAVRAVNDSYAAEIAARLPRVLGDRVASTYARRAYAKAYRPIRAEREIATALRRGSLAPSMRTDIEVLRANLGEELAPVRASLVGAIQVVEAEEYRGLASGDGRALFDARDALEGIEDHRAAIGDRYAERLREVMASVEG